MLIENSFDVDADPDRVFGFLQNPHNVATCFPGAELTEDLGDDRYKGKVKIKLGPVTASFTGTARITEKDETARVAVLVAEGKDARGSGTAKATATMRVEPRDGGSSVLLKTDLTISGRLAQFGRGIMADVSNRMVGDLAARVRERIEAEPESGTPGAPAAGTPDTTATETPAAAPATEAPATETAAADAAPSEAGTSAGTTEAEAPVATEPPATTKPSAATEPTMNADAGAGAESDAGANSGPGSGAAATGAKTAGDAGKAAAPTGTAGAAPASSSASSAEPASAIKASTMVKVVLAGMFRRLFARLRGRSDRG
ncbi:SRPBCC family protein [Actinoallomurus oryzae]